MTRIRLFSLAAGLLAGNCYASTIACPGCNIVERMFEHRDVPTDRDLVISSLESIARGQDVERSMLRGFLARYSSLGYLEMLGRINARAHALRLLSEIDDPEVMGFIRSLKIGGFGKDPSNQLDTMIVLAGVKVRVLHEPDPAVQLQLLESALGERSFPVGSGAVSGWAMVTLCDQGKRGSLPKIETLIRWSNQGRPDRVADEELDYCKAKMDFVESDPDRLIALSHALVVTSDPVKAQLAVWAVDQLDRIHSDRADKELSKYENAIRRLPSQAKERIALWSVPNLIDSIHSRKSEW